MNNRYLLCGLTFLLPSIFICNNNFELVDLNGLVKLFLFPVIFLFIIFIFNFLLFKKSNFLNNLSILLVLINLLLNFLIYKNSLIEIELFIIQNLIVIFVFVFTYKFFLKINLSILNYFFLFFIVSSLANFAISKQQTNKKYDTEESRIFKNNYLEKNFKLEHTPDIYHIIPDGLLNINELENYGYKNKNEFFSKIKTMDLEYYANSFTNYPATFFSISSSLNGSLVKENLNFYEGQINNTIYNSRLHRLLKKNNYEIFWYKTKWIGSNCNSSEYECMNDQFLNSELFFNYLLLLNFNHAWIDKIVFRMFNYQKKYHLDVISNDLEIIFNEQKPRYIFGYLNLPHGPYTVNKNCIPTNTKKLSSKIGFKKEHYFEQVDCFIKQLQLFAEKIKAKNGRPFLIIIQSDTGWAFNSKLIEEGRPHPDYPDRKWPQTYFKNFLAINKNFNCLNNSEKISGSDLFPKILNCLNNKKIKIQNDKKFDVYYSNHPKHGKIYLREDL